MRASASPRLLTCYRRLERLRAGITAVARYALAMVMTKAVKYRGRGKRFLIIRQPLPTLPCLRKTPSMGMKTPCPNWPVLKYGVKLHVAMACDTRDALESSAGDAEILLVAQTIGS